MHEGRREPPRTPFDRVMSLTDLVARERAVRAQLLDHVLRDLLHGGLLAREELREALLQGDADGLRVLAAGHRAQRGDGLAAATGGVFRERLTVTLDEGPRSRRTGRLHT